MKPGTDNKYFHSPVAGRFGLDRRKASRSDIGYTSRMYGVWAAAREWVMRRTCRRTDDTCSPVSDTHHHFSSGNAEKSSFQGVHLLLPAGCPRRAALSE